MPVVITVSKTNIKSKKRHFLLIDLRASLLDYFTSTRQQSRMVLAFFLAKDFEVSGCLPTGKCKWTLRPCRVGRTLQITT